MFIYASFSAASSTKADFRRSKRAFDRQSTTNIPLGPSGHDRNRIGD